MRIAPSSAALSRAPNVRSLSPKPANISACENAFGATAAASFSASSRRPARPVRVSEVPGILDGAEDQDCLVNSPLAQSRSPQTLSRRCRLVLAIS